MANIDMVDEFCSIAISLFRGRVS